MITLLYCLTLYRHTRIRYRRKGWPAGSQIGKVIALDFEEVKEMKLELKWRKKRLAEIEAMDLDDESLENRVRYMRLKRSLRKNIKRQEEVLGKLGREREVEKKMSNKDKVLITKEDFEYLKKRSWFLNQLEQGGVDNWSGYDYAYESLEDRILYEDLDAYNLISHHKYKDVERL